MKDSLSFSEKTFELSPYGEKKFSTATKTFSRVEGEELLRFEERRGIYVWVQPEEILFIKTADHYVKSLIQHDRQKKWMIRHCTMKDLLAILTYGHFIRLNKFYVINRKRFSYIDKHKKTLYLDDGFSIPISHRVSNFIIDMLKN